MDKRSRRKALLVCVFLICLVIGSRETKAQTQITKEPELITDLSKAFHVILKGATKEFIAGYVVDEAFLMWLCAEYGDEAVIALECSH